MIDQFLKWPKAIQLQSQDAETTATTIFHNVISRFGVPKTIHSDQCRLFESILFKHICDMLGIKHTRSSSYHPEFIGPGESCVHNLKEKLRMLSIDNKQE